MNSITPPQSDPARLGGVKRGWHREGRPMLQSWVVVIGFTAVLASQFIAGVHTSIQSLLQPPRVRHLTAAFGGGDVARSAVVNALVLVLLAVGAAAYVRWSGRATWRSLGLVPQSSWRAAAPTALAATAAYIAIEYLAGHWTGVILNHAHVAARPAQAVGATGSSAHIIVVATSVAAGVTEELQLFAIPLALLAWTRPKLGAWSVPVAFAAIEIMRLLIHLYYGWLALFVVPWMAAAMVLYRRVGLIWPFIIGHACYDTLALSEGIGSARAHAVLLGLTWTGSAAAVVLLLSWRRRPVRAAWAVIPQGLPNLDRRPARLLP